MQEHTGLQPSYEEETSFTVDEKTPLIEKETKSQQKQPGKEVIEGKEKKGGRPKLRKDPNTGILDLSKQDISSLKAEDLFLEEVKKEQKERRGRFIKSRYPKANPRDLVIGFSSKKILELVSIGPNGGETEIFLKDGSDFQQKFLNKTHVKNALGNPAESLINKQLITSGKCKKKEMKCAENKNSIMKKKRKKKKN